MNRSIAMMILFAQVGCSNQADERIRDQDNQVFEAGAFMSDENNEIVHEFKYKNIGKNKFHVLKVTKSCNCTSVDADKKNLDPGEALTVKMSIKPNKALGKWHVESSVETDEETKNIKKFAINYKTYPRAEFSISNINLGTQI